MNSADVFSLEFDMLTRTSQLGKILERFRATEIGAGTHRQLLLELKPFQRWHLSKDAPFLMICARSDSIRWTASR